MEITSSGLPKVAIIEMGSQYTLVIERRLRELGFRSVILDPKRAAKWLASHPVQLVILSGGASSVYDADAPQPPDTIFDLRYDGRPVPVLGICYGMQWIAQRFGGKVESAPDNREYGAAEILCTDDSSLFVDMGLRQSVWASHGDSVTEAPSNFIVTATSGDGGIAAMERFDGNVFGVQFHPEVADTPEGGQMFLNLLTHVAHCVPDWEPGSMVADIRRRIVADIGSDEKVIFGFSGGVDSTTIAAIAVPALGDRLLAVIIDGGNLREGELDEIRLHAEAAGVRLRIIDARGAFEEALSYTIDAEEKRRAFKKLYVAILKQAAEDFGATIIFQGTLATDRIESGATGGALIKSHHNVGLDFGDLMQAHPIDHLFKYEVRALARELGLPESVWARQPFPGPGLFLRINGVPATQERLEIARWADARVREVLQRRGIYDGLSQVVVNLLGVLAVGVKGDARTYAYPVVVRAVRTVDFMTAKGVHFDEETEKEICTTLTRHPQIVLALFNPTDKPPATTEWE